MLNVDGNADDAPLMVELLDDHDRPVPGYSGADAAKVTTNGTQLEIKWPAKKAAALPQGKTLAVRVKFPANSAAHLYALYVTE